MENHIFQAVLDQFMDRYFSQTAGPQTAGPQTAGPQTAGPQTAGPLAATPPEPATLPSATTDAQNIAGRYESSRRIEHGFLSVFYLLQQTVISANPGLWRLWTSTATWPARIGNGLIAAALLGLVWIGYIGGLISFNLNY